MSVQVVHEPTDDLYCRNCGYSFRKNDRYEDSPEPRCVKVSNCEKRRNKGMYSHVLAAREMAVASVDDMFDRIADRLQEECKSLMLHASSDEQILRLMFEATYNSKPMLRIADHSYGAGNCAFSLPLTAGGSW